MGRKAVELGALAVSRLTLPGLHFVGGVAGLALQVSKTGARSWILRVRVGGKPREMGLGGYPTVTLANARERARELRLLLDKGIDPIADRREKKAALAADLARAVTFQWCAKRFIDGKSAEWKNAKHAAQWSATLEQYAYPIIGKMFVRDVELPHVLRILEPIFEIAEAFVDEPGEMALCLGEQIDLAEQRIILEALHGRPLPFGELARYHATKGL